MEKVDADPAMTGAEEPPITADASCCSLNDWRRRRRCADASGERGDLCKHSKSNSKGRSQQPNRRIRKQQQRV